MPRREPYAKSKGATSSEVATNVDNFLEQTRKRILNAYLPIIILTRIDEIGFTTPKDIIAIIKKRYHIQVSPGTIYPSLYALEKQGLIVQIPKRITKIYLYTAKGKSEADQNTGTDALYHAAST